MKHSKPNRAQRATAILALAIATVTALGTGPMNALGEAFTDMEGWSQRVFVENIDPFEVTRTVADGASDLLRVRVIVEYQGPTDDAPREITRVTWIAPG